jgi:ATP-binding cassette subfamily C protein
MPGSIFTNIVGETELTRDDAWLAASQAGLDGDLRNMPMGMDTLITEASGTLSGGQKQRLLIARALAMRPRFLLFDEATSALDNITQKTVTESLERLAVTRIVIAHRLSTIAGADKIIVMESGRVTETGTYDELMANKGPFSELAARQIV